MLKPAILYKEEIIRGFQEYFYTDDMMYETGSLSNWCPEISDCPDEGRFQYAVVDNDNKVIGFISFYINWYVSSAYNFGIFSFDRGNVLMGIGLKEVMDKLFNDFKLHRIEWRMIGGNPVERSYDNFCKKYGGTKHILRDAVKDSRGEYHNDVIYEIINKS